MNGRGAPVGAWVWTIAVALAGIAVGVGLGAGGILDAEGVVLILLAPAYAALGLLIAVRQPGNRLAWLLLVVATWVVGSGATVLRLRNRVEPPDPPAVWDYLALVWDNSGYFIGMIIPLFLFLYIFPTGRFVSRRWALIGSSATLCMTLLLVVEALRPEIGPTDADWTIKNPIGFLDSGVEVLQAISGVGLVVLMVGGIVAIVARYRRSDSQVRAQIKWVVYALLVMAVIFIMSIFVNPVLPDWLDSVLFVLVLMVIPASVTLAITRYRLYEIDRLISRTFGYLVVVAVLGLVYALVAVWIPTQILGDQPPLFVAGATLAAAALFTPLRRLVLERVDRRFNRARYDGERVLQDFVSNLRNAADLDELSQSSLAVVQRTMQPQSVGMWVRMPTSDRSS